MKAIAFAIPVLIAISLLPIAGVGAQCSEYDYESEPIVGDYYPVDIHVEDSCSSVVWTFDMIGDK